LCERLSIRVQGSTDLNFVHTAATLLWLYFTLNISAVNYVCIR